MAIVTLNVVLPNIPDGLGRFVSQADWLGPKVKSCLVLVLR